MTKEKVYEVQVDRLVGPTHNYGGLSYGNIASMESKKQVSNPLAALIEGLEKMRLVAEQGIPQAILPPQLRPRLDFLHHLGYQGKDQELLERVSQKNPALLRAVFSSSAMWMANSATVAPSCDSADGAVHITPANLLYYPHRSLETKKTAQDLKILFPSEQGFVHHDPLPSSYAFSDEGAANHTLLTQQHGQKGLHLFVFGRSFYGDKEQAAVNRFPARQTQEASQAIARLHQLDPNHVLCLQQSPEALEAGVFHNDVIAVGHESLFFTHEQAFLEGKKAIETLKQIALAQGIPLNCIQVSKEELSLEEAAKSYLFNMQILRLENGKRLLLVSEEAMELDKSRKVLESLRKQLGDVDSIQVAPLRQSMRNGGGPACLRLRVVLTETELKRVHPYALWTPERHAALLAWGHRYYRTQLHPDDLLDPLLREEALAAQIEVHKILHWDASDKVLKS